MQKHPKKLFLFLIILAVSAAAAITFIIITLHDKGSSSADEAGTLYNIFPAKYLTYADGSSFSGKAGQCFAYLYWASWCPDCESILPGVDGLAAAVRENGFSFQMVDRFETGRETFSEAEQALTDKKLTELSIYDKDRVAYDSVGLTMIPTVIVTDAGGYVTSVLRGSLPDAKELISRLKEADTGKASGIYKSLADYKEIYNAESLTPLFGGSTGVDTYLPDLIRYCGSDREINLINSKYSCGTEPFTISDIATDSNGSLNLGRFYLKQVHDQSDSGQYTDIFNILKNAYIGDNVPLFYTEYMTSLASYKKEDLSTLKELSIMLSLSSVNALPQKSYQWLKDKVSSGTLWGAYDITGNAVSDYDAAAPYAMRYAAAALVALSENDRKTASAALEMMETDKNYDSGTDTEYLIKDRETGDYNLFMQYLALYVYELFESSLQA